MQWNSYTLSGFSSSKSWMALNPDYATLNVAQQTKNPESKFSKYKQLIKLRNSESILQYRSYEKINIEDDCIQFTRNYNNSSIKVMINFGDPKTINTPNNSVILLGSPILDTNDFIIYKYHQNQSQKLINSENHRDLAHLAI